MDERSEEVAEIRARVAFRIRELRKNNKLSVRGMAQKLNTHRRNIENAESGLLHHSIYTILRYCKFYNISIAEFMEGIDI